jgi:hypothetical protein
LLAVEILHLNRQILSPPRVRKGRWAQPEKRASADLLARDVKASGITGEVIAEDR